jgi:hypothetical protein
VTPPAHAACPARRRERRPGGGAADRRRAGDHFIAVHIQDMGAGKTYSQLSAESLAQPKNTALATTVSTVFKGETLRSMLLNAYGWWKVSQIVYIVSLVLFGLGTVAGLGAAYLLTFGRRPERTGTVAQPGAHESITPATTA